MAAKEQVDHGEGHDRGKRDVQPDDPRQKQEGRADEDADRRGGADASRHVPKEHLAKVNGAPLGEHHERRVGGVAAPGEVRHRAVEGKAEDQLSRCRRVEDVLSDAAKELLGSHNAHGVSDKRKPPGGGGRKDQGKAQARDGRGAVEDGELSPGEELKHRLEEDGGAHTDQHEKQGVGAVAVEAVPRAREHGQENQHHALAGGELGSGKGIDCDGTFHLRFLSFGVVAPAAGSVPEKART